MSTSASASAASSIDSAVGVGIVSTPGGAGTARFAASRTTSAPRRRASSASATPMRPDERLPTKRAASSGSRVPPAVTSDALAARGCPARAAARRGARSRRARPSGPRPTRPRRSRPRRARRARRRGRRSVSAFARVAGCAHMRGFIAGATSTGPRCASAASVSRLSESPCASFASVFAVHGATTSRSARVRWR